MKSILFLIGTFNDSKWDANITETLIFFAVFAAVLKPRLNFKYFEKKDYRHTFCIFEITDSENVVREMSKKSRVRRCFNKQYGKRALTLLKSSTHHLYHIHWSSTSKMSWEKSLLLRWKTLGLLVNTLAANEKYPVLNRDNLTIPIQMQLSQKQKTFSEFFAAFLKSYWNFERFEKKNDLHSFCIFKVTDSENLVWYMSIKSCFRGPCDK